LSRKSGCWLFAVEKPAKQHDPVWAAPCRTSAPGQHFQFLRVEATGRTQATHAKDAQLSQLDRPHAGAGNRERTQVLSQTLPSVGIA